jgi:hypothetical protein
MKGKDVIQRTKSNMMRFPAIAVLFAFSQVSAIQVECRQCQLVRQNEEYFERAKQAVQKRHAPTSVVVPVSSTSIATEQVMDRDNDIPAPEAPLVEMAASTGECESDVACLK